MSSKIEQTRPEGPLADKSYKLQNKAIYSEPFVQFGPDKCYLPNYFAENVDLLQNLEVKDDDVWLFSFIKAGTTWTKEMTWLLGNDLDFQSANFLNLYIRFAYLEFDAMWKVKALSDCLKPEPSVEWPTSMNYVSELMPSPRFIHSHLPWSLLPQQIQNGSKNPKMIYVARNPKDVFVSLYHHKVLIEGYTGTMDDAVDEFIGDLSIYSPYWVHVKKFWNLRNEPNVLFLTYEDLKRDLPGTVQKTAKFLGKSLNDGQMEMLMKHLSFESMKNNPQVNHDQLSDSLSKVHGIPRKTHFMRKGIIGSWKDELSPESIVKFDAWIEKNKIPGLWDDL